MAAKNGDWVRLTDSIYHIISMVGGKEYESSILIYPDNIVCPCHTSREVYNYPFITEMDINALADAIQKGGIGRQHGSKPEVVKALVKDMIEWYLVRNS